MNNRIRQFDILRVVATFTVIGIHVTAGYVLNYSFAYFCNQLARFAVPLFIIMSGFLLYSSDMNRNFELAGSFYKRRFSKILFPYIIWTVVYCLITYYLLRIIPSLSEFLIKVGKDLLWGTAYYHLYFIIIIIQLYLLYPLFRKWISLSPFFLLVISFLITLITQTLLYLNMIHIISLPSQYSNLYLSAFPVWMFYFILGMFTANKKDLCEKSLNSKSLLLAFLWVSSLLLLIVDSKYTSTYGSSIRPTVTLYTVVTYFFIYSLALRFNNIGGYSLTWLANQSFLIFLMHPTILTILERMAPKIGLPNLWAHNEGMVLIYMVTSLLTLLSTYLVSLTPIVGLLGGVSNRSIVEKDQEV